MVARGSENVSPIRTPFMQITRDYAHLRRVLGKEGKAFLPHPKYCHVVLLKGPGQEASDIADLGAFGSTMEGPMPDRESPQLQYIIPAQSQADLDKMISQFPPLYRDLIKIRPVQVENTRLVRYCMQILDSDSEVKLNWKHHI